MQWRVYFHEVDLGVIEIVNINDALSLLSAPTRLLPRAPPRLPPGKQTPLPTRLLRSCPSLSSPRKANPSPDPPPPPRCPSSPRKANPSPGPPAPLVAFARLLRNQARRPRVPTPSGQTQLCTARTSDGR
jgi:hypothetical protein